MNYVLLKDLIKELNLEKIYASDDLEKIKIYTTEVSRPGLQMAGYYRKFVPERIQVIGGGEWNYLKEMDNYKRYRVLEKFLSYPIPAVVISRNQEVFPELIELAKKYGKTVLRSKKSTSRIINDFVIHITIRLGPSTIVHGVMMEVFGIGVLIQGESGTGKSETALDLITRGFSRLVADDVVEITKMEDTLRATSPELIRYFLEIRGVGIIDVERLYGIGSVKQFDTIDLVVDLEDWDTNKEYQRLGLEEDSIEILGIGIPKVTIPIKPGRNIAMNVEIAAKNNRQKRLGYDAAKELEERVKLSIENRKNLYLETKNQNQL